MGLESIVRPFETPAFASPRRVIKQDAPAPDDNVVISVSGGSAGRTFTTSYTYALQRYMTKQIKEKSEASAGGGGANPNDGPNANDGPRPNA